MRQALAVFVFLVAAVASSQEPSPAKSNPSSLFTTTRFDAALVIRQHDQGPADDVELTVIKPNYSRDLLQKQLDYLGQELGNPPRGVRIYDDPVDSNNPHTTMIKAVFAVNGLIDRSAGALHLQPIVRAMSLSTSSDELNGLMVQFSGENPTKNTIRSCTPPSPGCSGVAVEGRFGDSSYGVEYRVKLLSHDPKAISLADVPTSAPPVKPVEVHSHTDWTLVALILVAAGAMGALVYSVLLRSRPGGRPKARPRASN